MRARRATPTARLERARPPPHAARRRLPPQLAQGLFAHLGDVPQTAYHLWHGTMANRNYAGRYDILTDHDYDPVRDLIDVPGAPLRWTDPASPMAKAVGAYFFSRREDGG